MAAVTVSDQPTLNVHKHALYWKRCLKTFLPHYYTSNDNIRMTLAFFTLSALDLLDQLNDSSTAADREQYANWIYANQLPDGGFRGSPATDFGSHRRTADNAIWDPANVPATVFALLSLMILGDDLERVKRRETLQWLTRMQRPDGSFGQTLGENGQIDGGTDTRFTYCAAIIRWVLRGDARGPVYGVPDIDVDKMVERIRVSQTYDGGIADIPFHEAHAGFAYCAISALSLVDRLPPGFGAVVDQSWKEKMERSGLTDVGLTIRWLVSRQTTFSADEDMEESNDGYDPATTDDYEKDQAARVDCAGFNGRCNKLADTCYSYWVGGSLAQLGGLDMIDQAAGRRFLLDRTQHMVGGFGKLPGHPPDIYHSYLGLATLAIMGRDGIKPFNAPVCVSNDAIAHLESLPWRKALLAEHSEDQSPQTVGARQDVRQASSNDQYIVISGG